MNAQTIMIASGKGGTGKSTISVMLGAQLAAQHKKILLVELDSGLRSVDIIAGVCGKTVYDVQDVLSGQCPPDKAVVESPLYPGLWVISAPYEGGHVDRQDLERLCHAMTPYFDYILLDTAAGMGEPFCAGAQVARQALLVITPDPVSLRDGRIVSDWLADHGLTDLRLVVNRLRPDTFRAGAVRDLDECIDTVCAQLIGVMPESPELQIAAALGQALPASCPAYAAAQNMALRLLGQRVRLLAF